MNIVNAKTLTLPTVTYNQAGDILAKLEKDRQKRNIKPKQNVSIEPPTTSPSFIAPPEVSHAEIEAVINAASDRNDTHGSLSFFFCVKFCKWAKCFGPS